MRERTQALNTLCQSADDKKGRNWLRPEFQLKSYFKHYRYVKPQELERSCFLRLCGAAEGPPPGCAARDFFSSAKVSSGALADLPSVASAPAAAAPLPQPCALPFHPSRLPACLSAEQNPCRLPSARRFRLHPGWR